MRSFPLPLRLGSLAGAALAVALVLTARGGERRAGERAQPQGKGERPHRLASCMAAGGAMKARTPTKS